MTMQSEEDLKKKVDGFQAEFERKVGKLLTPLNKMAEEFKTISVPKSKKDILINGKQGYISLLSDGRVVIHCSTVDDSQSVYDSFKEFKKKEKTWWQKIFS